MCILCKSAICVSKCPNYEAKAVTRTVIRCTLCGERIEESDRYYVANGFPYCESCLDFSDTETLVRICEIPKRKWLEQMGFVYESKEDAHDITEVL